MKKYVRLICLLLCLAFAFCSCSDTAEEITDTEAVSESSPSDDDTSATEEKKEGTVVNIDGDALTYMYKANGKNIDDLEAKCVKWFEDRYTDCGISDILYDLGTTVPNDTWESKYDRYTKTSENGVPVNYKDNEGCEASYRIYEETDVDPYAVWIRECRENGINPWLSFRMNDVHYANEATGHSDFFYTAKANGWMIGNSRASYWLNNACTQGSRDWYQYALDYSVPEVRAYFTEHIDDMLGRYDVYGIELDWHRTIWCFENDDVANCQYMDLLMEEVNRIVAKYEAQYGHEIKIMARIGRDIDENKYFGFDVVSWAQKDMIDVVVPASYWGSTDSDMPIAEWVEKLADYPKVEIYAGLECHTVNNSYWQSISSLAGYTAAYLSQGADKIYLYNMFNDIKEKFEVCSSLEKALGAAKRSYIVTESNATPHNAGFTRYDPLPLSLKVNVKSDGVTVNHGTLNTKNETVLYIAVSGVSASDIGESMLDVYYNGVKCSYKGASVKSYLANNDGLGTVIQYNIPKEAWETSQSGTVTFDAGMNLTVNYIELMNGNTRI